MDALSMLLAALAAAADESADAHAPPSGTVGLLTPPLVIDADTGCVRPDPKTSLTVHALPRTDAQVRGDIRFVADAGAKGECMGAVPRFFAAGDSRGAALRLLGSSYEEAALAVLETRPPWIRIGLRGADSGWVQAPADHRYDTVKALLVSGLDHFTTAWSGQICAQPGVGCSSFDDRAENTVRLLEARDVGATQWWRIEVTTPACGDIDPPKVLRSGWIPSRDDEGRPTLWFYSRGC